jgi:protoheme IX farnesyltransferase
LAGTPMLPVVATKSNVRRQMWFHAILMISSSVALIIFASLPLWSMALTILLGAIFAVQLLQLKDGSPDYAKVAGKIFQWSITYLSLFSVVLVVAQLLS